MLYHDACTYKNYKNVKKLKVIKQKFMRLVPRMLYHDKFFKFFGVHGKF